MSPSLLNMHEPLVLLIGLAAVLYLSGCTQEVASEGVMPLTNGAEQQPVSTPSRGVPSQGVMPATQGVEQEPEEQQKAVAAPSKDSPDVAVRPWRSVLLKDVRTGQEFRISDFEGKPILLESFAVWCPTCTKQQKILGELHGEVGDSVVSISLDTDPNEDEARIQEHLDRNGFNWYYAVSPAELTQDLIDEFGVGIVNAPQAPVVLICEDQSSRMLGRGVKNVDKLMEEIAAGC